MNILRQSILYKPPLWIVQENRQANLRFWLSLALMSGIYFFQADVHAIWNVHESYYAVTVREMLASGDWWNFTYNEAPRYNKPPLTYWLMASSARLFGLSEFSLRLPSILLALATLVLTYGMGRQMLNRRVGLWAFWIAGSSFHLLLHKHYASPEVPLLFFFTLTHFAFWKMLKSRKKRWLWLAYMSLGFTIATKGFPYLILIFFALVMYWMFRGEFSLQRLAKRLYALHIIPGVLLSLLIGFSWTLISGWQIGAPFWEVFYSETLGRSLSHPTESHFLMDLFFYPGVMLWAFLPASLAFFVCAAYTLKFRIFSSPLLYGWAWILSMLVVFTFSKGKLPAYFLQAHPPMAIIVAYFLIYNPIGQLRWKKIWLWSWLIPSLALVCISVLLMYLFNLTPSWLILLSFVGIAYFFLKRDIHAYAKAAILSMLMAILLYYGPLSDQIEQFRPYTQIAKAIRDASVPANLPLKTEEQLIHNLPYYSQRQVQPTDKSILMNTLASGDAYPVLALLKMETWQETSMTDKSYILLWKGPICNLTEAHTFKFFRACWQWLQGDDSHFTEYVLIVIEAGRPLTVEE